jgi:M6 family metalloprotease-like protein
LIAVLCLALPLLALFAPHALQSQELLGLKAPETVWLGEGPTDVAKHPPGTGTLKAVMLFARFSDGDQDESMRSLHARLVPGAVAFYEASSQGRMTLEVTPHFEWYDMQGVSTDPGYDCSEHAPHKRYLQEVVDAADEDVDFAGYDVIYVVANRAPGVFNSPTFNAHGGEGLRADGHHIRHAVTFGNDVRGERWGWQTLVHETGHVLGLPDLYSYVPEDDAYKSFHLHTGSWSPMGFQAHALEHLAWNKRKLGWLDDDDFEVVTAGQRSMELTHIGAKGGLKAVEMPTSQTEAFVAEVRHLGEAHPEHGVLVYRVSVTTATGHGPIQVLPARPDDDEAHPELARRYIALYDALHGPGESFVDEATGVRIDVAVGEAGGFRLDVARAGGPED